ncbi:MAG: hypothetical protein EBT95_00220 [Verrucomicrobia bacterium]|nr:hypothetical protein [Verrucomicrobiota bacterium]
MARPKVSKKILWEIAEKIMSDRGWTPEQSPIEFDRNRDDSQIVLIKEDLEDMLTYFSYSEVYCEHIGCKKKDMIIFTHTHEH